MDPAAGTKPPEQEERPPHVIALKSSFRFRTSRNALELAASDHGTGWRTLRCLVLMELTSVLQSVAFCEEWFWAPEALASAHAGERGSGP